MFSIKPSNAIFSYLMQIIVAVSCLQEAAVVFLAPNTLNSLNSSFWSFFSNSISNPARLHHLFLVLLIYQVFFQDTSEGSFH